MKYIVRHIDTIPERVECVRRMANSIPGLVIVRDATQNAMDTFLAAMEAAGEDECVHMEDDIELCNHFSEKVNRFISLTPTMPIQFFSLSRKITKTTVRPGRTFSSNLCFYLPAGMSREIREYHDTSWVGSKVAIANPTGYDIMMSRYFSANGLKYVMVVPSLVQHEPWISAINPKRSSRRQALYFDKGGGSSG